MALFRPDLARTLVPGASTVPAAYCAERQDIQQRYWKGVLWSPSYFAASCGGAPISIVRQYIEQQQTPT